MNAVVETTHKKLALSPRNLDEAIRFAEIISKSSIVPKDYQNNEGNCLVAMQWGAELGLAPLQSMQNIAVINGRPAVYGDAMLSLVRASGLLVSIEEEQTENEAVCVIQRKGEKPVTKVFSVNDAKRAGLWGKSGPWTMYPKRMLQMRARAFALRDVFPDVLKGIHIAEEAQDIPAEKDMGVAEVIQTKSKADSVKAKIMPKPSLVEIMDLIDRAESFDDLKVAGEKAALLSDGIEKDQAREAYMQKFMALKNKPQEEEAADEVLEEEEIDEEGVVHTPPLNGRGRKPKQSPQMGSLI